MIRCVVAVLALIGLAVPTPSRTRGFQEPSSARDGELRLEREAGNDWVDPFGKPLPWSSLAGDGWNVVLAIGCECPLARLYATRIEELADRPEFAEVRWTLVSVMPQDGPLDLQQFRNEFGRRLPLAKDVSGTLVEAARLERVPTALLISPDGRIVYRGRVDDQYEVGRRREAPTRQDLADALDSALGGRPIELTPIDAPGCLIPVARPAVAEPTYLFSRDIAPILDRHCVRCHRPGDIGPMALIDGDEVAGWSEMILETIDDGRMPPWHAADPAGSFRNENRMEPHEREVIATWIEQGCPLGDPNERPVPPTFAASWRMPTAPDQVIELPGEGCPVPAEGTVEYQYFVVDPGWTEDRWLVGAQLLPGVDSVVHHAIVFLRSPETDRFDGLGWVAAYVPGQEPIRYDDGLARRIPAGSKLIFQMHYTPDGSPRVDRSRLGLWFTDESQVRDEVVTAMLVNSSFEIPPQASRHEVTASQQGWPEGTRLLAVAPHMHVRGKGIEVTLDESGVSSPLLRVPRYDFGWQHTYRLAEPRLLAPGTAVSFRATFDNSSANIANPDPTRAVRWGEQTWQEMAVVFLDLAIPRDETANRVDGSASADRRQRGLEFLRRFDADGDGKLKRSEVPETFSAFAFERVDANEDDRLDADELQQVDQAGVGRRSERRR